MKTILVTGGAGYIGSIMTDRLIREGYAVIVLDSLERGHLDAVSKDAVFIRGDVREEAVLEKVFSSYAVDGVVHFAGYIAVGESMQNPGMYFLNNTFGTLTLLSVMVKKGVSKIIFSSTAGVYGNPQSVPIQENHSLRPESPYGESKRHVEELLRWFRQAHNISFVSLRYFNAAGAALNGSLGENHIPESHIIPNLIHAGMKKETFTLFGDDYDTKDGTCVRDYIHVEDLATAHVLGLKKIEESGGGYIYNVGTGNGYSNKEVVSAVKEITGLNIEIATGSRREGDPAVLIADSSAIKKNLGFTPSYSDLKTIIESAWLWHKKQHG